MKEELIAPGHTACAGCGEILGVKFLLQALGENCIICQATGCMEITTTKYPTSAFKVPWIHVAFENAAAVASGIARALKKQGKENITAVAMAGDGGMADIGFQAMSGAMERGEDILIVCTDNEAYMNTGIQRSGTTPLFAATTTSPAGKVIPGNKVWKKNLALIAAAHGIPYVATASISYPFDLKEKVKKAVKIRGPKFIHIHTPCPIGWKFDSDKTIEIGKLAVETGMWALHEIENGKMKMTYRPEKLKPVKDYIQLQGRFKHVGEKELAELQKTARREYERLLALEKSSA